MKAIFISAIILFSATYIAGAQNLFPKSGSAGIFTTSPKASAALDIDTTGLGLLIPRMTKAQRDAIASPATSLLIYQKDNIPGFYYYDGTSWTAISQKGANTSLGNLNTPVSINQSLFPDNNAMDLGTSSNQWQKIFLLDGLQNITSKIFSADSSNVATGANALGLNTSSNNSALGADALHSDKDGNFNTAIGTSALFYNTTGKNNTAVGIDAAYKNVSGNLNTSIGYFALASNANGATNVSLGSDALYLNTTGFSNVAVGFQALDNNTEGSRSVSIGESSLHTNNTSGFNIAIGNKPLMKNISGAFNIAIGDSSLYWVSTSSNLGIGYRCLSSNLDGNNLAIGTYSMLYCQHATGNIAIGGEALSKIEKSSNCALGYHASFNAQLAGGNTAFGAFADNADGYYTSTAIGYGASTNENDHVKFGNGNVTSIGGQVGWTTFSDGRYKKNIKENVPGLEFINALRPITYTVDVNGLNDYRKQKTGQDILNAFALDDESNASVLNDVVKASKTSITGFIAREVEAAAKKYKYNFSGVDKPDKKDGLYGLRYSEFVVPLVKAVQELSKQIDDLKSRINNVETMIEKANVRI